jgi:hypothetical protein
MKAATRLWPAMLILACFFLIRIYLCRLPIARVVHGPDIDSFIDVEDGPSTEVKEALELAPMSALNDGQSQHRASAAVTATTQDQNPTPTTSSSYLDQIIVMGRTNSDDTSWVEKLPMSVILAMWILSYDEC